MQNLLYVILRHEGLEQPHFDLMFQTAPGSALATWRAPEWRPIGPMAVEKLGDHRAAYLTREGEISGGRGTVRRLEQGLCQIERSEEVWMMRLRPVPIGEEITLRINRTSGSAWVCTPSSEAQ